MPIDRYTKAVLTVIAIMLTVIACDHYVTSTATAHAQGPFDGVQATSNGATATFFDTRTGELWTLELAGRDQPKGPPVYPPKWMFEGKIGKLGSPVMGWENKFK